MLATFEVLAEGNRRRILDLLRDRERPVGDLVQALSISQPAVSKHLRVLRDAGLVEARIDAQRRLYRVRCEPLKEIDQWLAPYRAMWTTSLDALERHLDDMADPTDLARKEDQRHVRRAPTGRRPVDPAVHPTTAPPS